jgi:hypothetical protein
MFIFEALSISVLANIAFVVAVGGLAGLIGVMLADTRDGEPHSIQSIGSGAVVPALGDETRLMIGRLPHRDEVWLVALLLGPDAIRRALLASGSAFNLWTRTSSTLTILPDVETDDTVVGLFRQVLLDRRETKGAGLYQCALVAVTRLKAPLTLLASRVGVHRSHERRIELLGATAVVVLALFAGAWGLGLLQSMEFGAFGLVTAVAASLAIGLGVTWTAARFHRQARAYVKWLRSQTPSIVAAAGGAAASPYDIALAAALSHTASAAFSRAPPDPA